MNIYIKGDFFDCQIHKGKLYIWDTWGFLYVFNWRALMEKERVDGNDLVISHSMLRKYEYSSVKIKGGIFPMDSAFVEDHLFTATESGLYRRYIPEGSKRMTRFREGRSRNLLEGVRVFSLSVNQMGETLAISAGNEGLLEWYDKDKYSVTKQKQKVVYEIYKVRKAPSLYSSYLSEGLFSANDVTTPIFCYYQERRSREGISRSMLRAYTGEQMEVMRNSQRYWTDDNNIYALGEDSIDSFAVTGNTQNMIERRGSIALHIPSTQRVRKAASASFGHVLDYKNKLTVTSKDGLSTHTIEGPITRWRILKSRKPDSDLLAVVLDDLIRITDLK